LRFCVKGSSIKGIVFWNVEEGCFKLQHWLLQNRCMCWTDEKTSDHMQRLQDFNYCLDRGIRTHLGGDLGMVARFTKSLHI
jgi:hypothetical protein